MMHHHVIDNFGNTVRRLREARGWSQEKLAEQADLNRSYVGEIERGKTVVSIITIEKLGIAFGFSGADLLQQTESTITEQLTNGIELMAIAC